MTWQTVISHGRSSLPFIGVSIKFARGFDQNFPVSDDQNIAMAVGVGAKMIRKDINWADCELSPGVYTFGPVKTFVDKCIVNGIQPLLILARGNLLYTGAWDSPPVTQSARVAYKNFVVALITHLGTGHFEIQNEPNNPQMWGGPPDPEAYGRLLNEVLLGVVAANLTRPIISGGLSIGGPGFMPPTDFMAAMLPFVTVNPTCFRGWGMHPYTGADQYFSDPMMRPEKMQARMAGLRAPSPWNKPAINTEQGYPVNLCTGATYADKANRQAIFAQRFVFSALMGYYQDIWYDLIDDGTDPNNSEHNYGLYDFSFNMKPSGKAFKAVTILVNTCTSLIVQKDGELYRVKFTMPDGTTPSFVWSSVGDVPLSVQETAMPLQIVSNT